MLKLHPIAIWHPYDLQELHGDFLTVSMNINIVGSFIRQKVAHIILSITTVAHLILLDGAATADSPILIRSNQL